MYNFAIIGIFDFPKYLLGIVFKGQLCTCVSNVLFHICICTHIYIYTHTCECLRKKNMKMGGFGILELNRNIT